MRRIALVLLLVAGCGGGDDDAGTAAQQQQQQQPKPKAEQQPEQQPQQQPKPGATIVVGDSEFGTMLFDSRKQAIYVFENDGKNRSNCYGECAVAWPPVLTKGEPEARSGVDDSLLGTIRRRDGSRQVTYAGKPLYFYAHEGPGEVRCHNVDLNGGLWWVIAPSGERRA
jgi:predicted lipoprotein with Yx(FWY)xxD motif